MLAIRAEVGATVAVGDQLLTIEPRAVDAATSVADVATDLDHVRADLAAVIDRHAFGSTTATDPRRSSGAAARGSAPPARTSPTSSTTAR